jgi:hypothetical protein
VALGRRKVNIDKRFVKLGSQFASRKNAILAVSSDEWVNYSTPARRSSSSIHSTLPCSLLAYSFSLFLKEFSVSLKARIVELNFIKVCYSYLHSKSYKKLSQFCYSLHFNHLAFLPERACQSICAAVIYFKQVAQLLRSGHVYFMIQVRKLIFLQGWTKVAWSEHMF